MGVQKIKVDTPRDMSATWNKKALIYNLFNAEDGSVPTLRLPNKYIALAGIEQNFEKNSITIRADAFIKLIEEEYGSIVDAIKSYTKNASSPEIDLNSRDITWTTPVTNATARASFTAYTTLKYIGNSRPKPSPESMRDTSFTAYVVLTMPMVYVDTETRRVSVPLHAKTVGIVKLDDELEGVDMNKLSLA